MKAAVLNDYDEPLEITDVQIDEPGPRGGAAPDGGLGRVSQ